MNISIVGKGYVSLVTGVYSAEFGVHVTSVDGRGRGGFDYRVE